MTAPTPRTGLYRHEGVLTVDGVPLTNLAATFGTPTYVYSGAAVEAALAGLEAGLGGLPHLVCYAVKANASSALLDLLARAGAAFDAVSVGELARVLAVGVDASRVILSGVGKRDDEIAAGLGAGVLYLGVESEAELDAVARIAKARGVRARVVLRVNPDVDPRTHPYISTGLAENKFGIPHDEAFELADRALGRPDCLELCGVSCHIGSQITTIEPFADAARRMAAIAGSLQRHGAPMRYVGLGGGLGITYADEEPPPPAAYAATVREVLGPLGLTVVLEPGRAIVGGAGVLLARVVRRKHGADREFVLIDAAMNDLIRPALYSAHHAIEPVSSTAGELAPYDVVGPVCESADTFARGRMLPPLAEGDLVAIATAGAYGFTMSSNYNGRPRPAEVLVHEGRAVLSRERERLADLWRGERRLDGSSMPGVLPAALRSLTEDER